MPILRLCGSLLVLTSFVSCSTGEAPSAPERGPDTSPVIAERILLTISKDLIGEGQTYSASGSVSKGIRVGDVWPSGRLVEGSEPRLSLILSASEEVLFRVPSEPGRYILEGEAGLDLSTKELGAPLRVRVSILEGDRLVGEATLTFHASMLATENIWRALSATPIELQPGSEVRFKTEVLDWGGAPQALEGAVKIGISMPRILREESMPVRAATAEYPNIVFIVMDTLRQDRLGTYGYENARTPNLDALAERGLVYEDAHASSSWTWPSTASMLTGLLPEEHGVVDTSSCYLASRFETLAESLRESGYATTGYSGNPLISPRRNFSQGFDEFLVDSQNFRPSQDFLPHAIEWVEEHREERFFLYMQLVDTHDPYTPLPQFGKALEEQAPAGYPYTAVIDFGSKLRKRYGEDPIWGHWTDETIPPTFQDHMSKLYDACVESADFGVGQLLAKLDALQLTEKTLVVFTSDHGDEFLDHGLLSHGQSLHGELTRVPLIFAGPGVTQGREARTVTNRDLAFTLAKLGGGTLGRDGDNQDLLQPGHLDDRAIFLSSQHGIRNGGHTPLFGVRKGGWLYSLAPEARAPHPNERLYDTGADKLEINNLADKEKEMLQTLQTLVERRLERSKEVGPKQGFEAGEATLEFFEKIGYSGD